MIDFDPLNILKLHGWQPILAARSRNTSNCYPTLTARFREGDGGAAQAGQSGYRSIAFSSSTGRQYPDRVGERRFTTSPRPTFFFCGKWSIGIHLKRSSVYGASDFQDSSRARVERRAIRRRPPRRSRSSREPQPPHRSPQLRPRGQRQAGRGIVGRSTKWRKDRGLTPRTNSQNTFSTNGSLPRP